MRIETRAVHAGRHIDPATAAVTLPIYLTSTFERAASGRYPLGYSYSREGNPTRHALEVCLADLEGGKEALAFSSGSRLLRRCFRDSNRATMFSPPTMCTGPAHHDSRRFRQVAPRYRLRGFHAPRCSTAAIRPNTRLMWMETPSNPLMKICDLAAVAALARESAPNAITVCDGTFATRSCSGRSSTASTWWRIPPRSTSTDTATWSAGADHLP
jgi:cystathionine gamma-synthase